jgi:hypothetical protein
MSRPVNGLDRHGLTYDQTGTGHDRITCLCGKTIVRQPWMTDAVWRSRFRIFVRDNNHGEQNSMISVKPESKEQQPCGQ